MFYQEVQGSYLNAFADVMRLIHFWSDEQMSEGLLGYGLDYVSQSALVIMGDMCCAVIYIQSYIWELSICRAPNLQSCLKHFFSIL